MGAESGNHETGAPWRATPWSTSSTTKGVASLIASRGLPDYDAKVDYWPECLRQNGKEAVTAWQTVGAPGRFGSDYATLVVGPVRPRDTVGQDRRTGTAIRSPGAHHGYHAVTLWLAMRAS